MKTTQKLSALFLVLIIIFSLTSCGQKAAPDYQAEQQSANSDQGKANEESPTLQKEAEVSSGGLEEIIELMEKAKSIDNFYTEFTEYREGRTTTSKVWYNGEILKSVDFQKNISTGEPETGVRIFNSANIEQVYYVEESLTGYKNKLDEEYRDVTLILTRGPAIFHYQLFQSPHYWESKKTGVDTVNGFDCITVEIKTVEDEIMKYAISKRYGIIIKFEMINSIGSTNVDFNRTVFEPNKASDNDFAFPDDKITYR